MSVAMATMGKKRTPPGPKPGPETRKVIASLKGSAEFEGWVEELGRFLRLKKSDLIEHGLVELARARGFKKEPPER